MLAGVKPELGRHLVAVLVDASPGRRHGTAPRPGVAAVLPHDSKFRLRELPHGRHKLRRSLRGMGDRTTAAGMTPYRPRAARRDHELVLVLAVFASHDHGFWEWTKSGGAYGSASNRARSRYPAGRSRRIRTGRERSQMLDVAIPIVRRSRPTRGTAAAG